MSKLPLTVGAGAVAVTAGVLLAVLLCSPTGHDPQATKLADRSADSDAGAAKPLTADTAGVHQPNGTQTPAGGIELPDWNPADLAAPSTAAPNLVAHYTFDDSGRPATEKASPAFAGATIAFDADRDSNVLVLDGADDRFDIPRPVQDHFTIALWIKTNQQGTGGGYWHMGVGIIDGDVPGPAEDFGLSLMGDNAAAGVGRDGKVVRSTTPINDGDWHHVAVTRNAGTGRLGIYVDGNFEDDRQAPRGRKDAASQLTVGCIQSDPRFLRGRLDDIRFYNYVLPQPQIRELAASP
jgi:hypothetical protein